MISLRKQIFFIKIKAYTLPELIVVMILSSLLSLSIWSGYEFLNNRFIDFMKNSEAYENVLQLERFLRNDFYRSSKINSSLQKQLIFEIDNEIVVYDFNRESVTRTTSKMREHISVLNDKVEIEYLKFDDKEVSNVISLSIEIVVRNRKCNLFFYKDYPHVFLIKQ